MDRSEKRARINALNHEAHRRAHATEASVTAHIAVGANGTLKAQLRTRAGAGPKLDTAPPEFEWDSAHARALCAAVETACLERTIGWCQAQGYRSIEAHFEKTPARGERFIGIELMPARTGPDGPAMRIHPTLDRNGGAWLECEPLKNAVRRAAETLVVKNTRIGAEWMDMHEGWCIVRWEREDNATREWMCTMRIDERVRVEGDTVEIGICTGVP